MDCQVSLPSGCQPSICGRFNRIYSSKRMWQRKAPRTSGYTGTFEWDQCRLPALVATRVGGVINFESHTLLDSSCKPCLISLAMEDERAKKGWKKNQGFQNCSSISVIGKWRHKPGHKSELKQCLHCLEHFTERTKAAKEDGPVKISVVDIRHKILVLSWREVKNQLPINFFYSFLSPEVLSTCESITIQPFVEQTKIFGHPPMDSGL